jgi:hypothetical protein
VREQPAMALKRLTIQAKKSFPGLYSSNDPESQQSHEESSMASKRFTLQAKKSLTGLYCSNSAEDQQLSKYVAVELLQKIHY